jgi:predicted transcriptional regulator
MVKQKPKRYSQRQQDKHQERAKNIMKKQKKAKPIVRMDDKYVEEIATDFSHLIIEKANLNTMLKEANTMTQAYIAENHHLRKQIKIMNRSITCLISTIICLVAAVIFLII